MSRALMLEVSERYAEDHVESERIRGGTIRRSVEAKDKIAFDKVSPEEAVFYRPALDDQRRDSELRRLRLIRIQQEPNAASSGKAVPQPPQEPGIYNKLNFSWLVHDELGPIRGQSTFVRFR